MNNTKQKDKIKFKIESKNDFLTGAYLTVSIPENDLDQNALHTIQTDCPDFILPFNYVCTNGLVEFTYKIGSLCKLQYFYGDISHEEYIIMWRSLLSPLLECGDWYMNPHSFALCTDYLYYDKTNKKVVYLYVPSLKGCSGSDAFNEMAVEIVKNIVISDTVLENKILRSILSDFDPGSFLKMLVDYKTNNEQIQTADILNQINPEIITDNEINEEPGGNKISSSRSRKKPETKRNGYKNIIPVSLPVPNVQKIPVVLDITQETTAITSGPGFRCKGRAQLPQLMEVTIADGEIYTIGRFDASVGKKQSNFEFDKKTKAVSRRHAVVERTGSVYKITDLSSSAGTYINGVKLLPNTPYELMEGSCVSFGNLGADYVWEVS